MHTNSHEENSSQKMVEESFNFFPINQCVHLLHWQRGYLMQFAKVQQQQEQNQISIP